MSPFKMSGFSKVSLADVSVSFLVRGRKMEEASEQEAGVGGSASYRK